TPKGWEELDQLGRGPGGQLSPDQGPTGGVAPLFGEPGGLSCPYNRMRQSTNIIDLRDENVKAIKDNTEQLSKLNQFLMFNQRGGCPSLPGGNGRFGGGGGIMFRPGIGPGRGGGGGGTGGSAKMSDEAGIPIDPETEKQVEEAAKRGDVGGMQKILNEK